MVAGVVTFATQSAGCEIAGGIKPRPFLLFHGERDEILPVEASAVVREIADCGELVVLPNDGHALAKSGPDPRGAPPRVAPRRARLSEPTSASTSRPRRHGVLRARRG